MHRDELSQNSDYRYLHEFLFSLNIALVVRWKSAATSLSPLEPNLQFRINGALHLQPNSHFGGYAAFFALVLVVALSIFTVLRLFSRTRLAEEVLGSIAGPVSLVALPVCWLYVTYLFPLPRGLPNPPRAGLFIELAGATVCAVLYLWEKRPFLGWKEFALLLLHFCFWGWLFLGGFYFWRSPIKLIFPLAGFCSCLVWAKYCGGIIGSSRSPRPCLTR
jgi:hypothetical protein